MPAGFGQDHQIVAVDDLMGQVRGEGGRPPAGHPVARAATIAPLPPWAWNASAATNGVVSTISTTRRYCMTATMRLSAPSSSLIEMIPWAPPAIRHTRCSGCRTDPPPPRQ